MHLIEHELSPEETKDITKRIVEIVEEYGSEVREAEKVGKIEKKLTDYTPVLHSLVGKVIGAVNGIEIKPDGHVFHVKRTYWPKK